MGFAWAGPDGRSSRVAGRVYPLEWIAEAHRYVDGDHKHGNVVVTVARARRVRGPIEPEAAGRSCCCWCAPHALRARQNNKGQSAVVSTASRRVGRSSRRRRAAPHDPRRHSGAEISPLSPGFETTYDELLREISNHAEALPDEGRLHWPMHEPSCTGRMLVVGQAFNGWGQMCAPGLCGGGSPSAAAGGVVCSPAACCRRSCRRSRRSSPSR